jgi:hypothetical protein
MPETVVPGLERRLKAQLLGEVQFDAFSSGRYATDASHDQIMPIGVVAPSSTKEVEPQLKGCVTCAGSKLIRRPLPGASVDPPTRPHAPLCLVRLEPL